MNFFLLYSFARKSFCLISLLSALVASEILTSVRFSFLFFIFFHRSRSRKIGWFDFFHEPRCSFFLGTAVVVAVVAVVAAVVIVVVAAVVAAAVDDDNVNGDVENLNQNRKC